MPHIHHVAVWVQDMDRVCAFYADILGARIGDLYENPAKGFASRFLHFDEGARIEIMTSSQLSLPVQDAGAQRLGITHLAISVGTERAVDELAARVAARGVPVIDGPRRTGDGYYECVVLDPEGNRIEVTE